MNDISQSPLPLDQADGLRRLFARTQTRFLPVASNPQMAFGGVMLERICTALASLGAHTVVVDAAERAPQPKEWAMMDLADCIETLSADVSYLAARGLHLRFVDTRGSTTTFLQAVADACPQADVILVHAGAADLCRMFGQADQHRCARPLVLADEHPASVTHAYANIKLLSQRGGNSVQDLLLCAGRQSRRAERICNQLARCAEDFLAAALGQCLRVDPAGNVQDSPGEPLRRWALEVIRPTPAVAFVPPSQLPIVQQPWSAVVAQAYRATDAALALN